MIFSFWQGLHFLLEGREAVQVQKKQMTLFWFLLTSLQTSPVTVILQTGSEFLMTTLTFCPRVWKFINICDLKCVYFRAVAHRPCLAVASPPRPSFLPISEPIPVPTQRCVYQQLHPNDGLPSPTKVNDLVVLL